MTLLGLKCWISQSQRSSGNKTINLTSNFSKSPLPFILLKENGGHTLHTGCSLNIVLFRKFQNIFWTLASLSVFPQCVHRTKWQVENQRFSRTGRVKKNHNILRKNTVFNEHSVCKCVFKNYIHTIHT